MAPGSLLRSTSLVNIPASVLAGLHLLDEVLDGSSCDTRTTLMVLTSHAAQAVPSYLGLSVLAHVAGEAPLEITTLQNNPVVEHIGASLRFRVRADPSVEANGSAPIELILYAAQPGAIVDLAADLTWVTGRPWRDFRIDEDLDAAQESPGTASLTSWSTINQARGVLISKGLTVEQADSELDTQAAATGIGRHHAAAELLAGVCSGQHPPNV